MRSTILGSCTINCCIYAQKWRSSSLVPIHMHGKGAGSLSWQSFHVSCRKLGLLGKFMQWFGRQSQQSFSADNAASSPLQSKSKGFPLSQISSPISKYIIFMALTYPILVLKWTLQLPEWSRLPACAKEDHRLSGWMHLSVTKMEYSLAITQHHIFQEWPEQSTTVWGGKEILFNNNWSPQQHKQWTYWCKGWVSGQKISLYISSFSVTLKQCLNRLFNVEIKSMKALRVWNESSIYETILLNTICVISGFCCEADVNSAVLKTIICLHNSF